MTRKILVTGAAGFIGSKIAKKLLDENYDVIGIDDLSSGNIKNIPSKLNFIDKDLSSDNFDLSFLSGVDTIMHLAGQSSGEISFEDPLIDLRKNTVSTLNLIRFCKKTKVKKFIYASSMSVYGEVEDKPIREDFSTIPISCYGVGKLASERYLHILGGNMSINIMRMFNVYGPGQDLDNMKQGMVSIYLSQAIKSNKIIVKGSLERFRDFIYIDDVVDSWIKAMNLKNNGLITLNIGSGKKTTVKQLLSMIQEGFDDLDIQINKSTPGDQTGIYSNNSLMKKSLGIQKLTSLQDGLKLFINSLKK